MPSIKELRRICQGSDAPSARSQSIMGRFNRVFSIYLTAVFIHLPFTPNQITVFGTALYLAGAGLFLKHEFAYNLTGVLLIIVSFLVDAVDGELARYRKLTAGGGVGGVYVEPVTHDVQYAWVFLPIAVGQYLERALLLPLLAGFVATSSKLLFRLLEFRYDALQRFLREQNGTGERPREIPKTPTTISYFIFRNFFTGTGMTLVLFITVLARHVDWFLYFYGAGFFLLWVILQMKQVKKIWRKQNSKA